MAADEAAEAAAEAQRKAEEAQREVEWDQRPPATSRHVFGVSNATVRGIDEERYADDHLYAKARGEVKQPAEVEVTFDQLLSVPLVTPKGTVIASLKVSEYQSKGLAPELALQLGELMIEEAKRVIETRKEQPLQPGNGLVIASNEQDVHAAAAALDPDALAGAGQ